jgi:tetratricopeptide (TPR) repeat protein
VAKLKGLAHFSEMAAAEAARFKDLGNEALKAGQADKAAELYTKAIQLDPRNHLLYSNRAAALASLGEFERALSDSAHVIALEPTWVKGHARKGGALKALKRYAESIAAYQHALRLEPQNAQVRASLEEVEMLHRNGGRNWADDLASSDEDDGAKAAAAPSAGVKRPRADDPPSRRDAAPARRAVDPRPPSKHELARVQEALAGADVHTLRACLLQMAKVDADLSDRIVETIEQLGEGSSEGEGEGGSGDEKSSADSDDV